MRLCIRVHNVTSIFVRHGPFYINDYTRKTLKWSTKMTLVCTNFTVYNNYTLHIEYRYSTSIFSSFLLFTDHTHEGFN